MLLPDIPKWFKDDACSAGFRVLGIEHYCRDPRRRLQTCQMAAGLVSENYSGKGRGDMNCHDCDYSHGALIRIKHLGTGTISEVLIKEWEVEITFKMIAKINFHEDRGARAREAVAAAKREGREREANFKRLVHDYTHDQLMPGWATGRITMDEATGVSTGDKSGYGPKGI